MNKTTDEGWNPYRLVIREQITLFCMHKTTGEGWNQYSFFSSCANHAVMSAQNNRLGLGPIQTCMSGPKVDVLHVQNHR